jgi:hypothetical protein
MEDFRIGDFGFDIARGTLLKRWRGGFAKSGNFLGTLTKLCPQEILLSNAAAWMSNNYHIVSLITLRAVLFL